MKFTWGSVIERFNFNFDGVEMNVIKYHPWIYDKNGRGTQMIDENKINYSCEEISRSDESLFALTLYWIAHKQLGLNQGALVQGICKALNIESV